MKIVSIDTDKGVRLTVGDAVRTRKLKWKPAINGVILEFGISNSVSPVRALVDDLTNGNGPGWEDVNGLRKVGK